jgi:hypothetical protein
MTAGGNWWRAYEIGVIAGDPAIVVGVVAPDNGLYQREKERQTGKARKAIAP